ncbi:uncharacterized protein LOC127256465 isoform X2 [Andrographis paniculata]|uniref:uncharacterized protein LOC127256465 isoform X2 n=2 Tax=Andrographis paniculata TaxID=175694 RepID=UPI0021E7FA77|nr:uncharacterized protein LOC127256465 isoform X2 [Andrographis paniculata]
MNRSLRASERGQMGSVRMKDGKDEDLALFREMRKREKERNDLLLLQNSDEFDAPLGPKTGSSPIFNITSGIPAPVRKSGADDFLNSDYDKNDYDWLLTPPGTPLFPSLEKESQRTVMSQMETPTARPTTLKSRLANPQLEPVARSNLSRQPTPSQGLNTSSERLRRPSSSGGPGSRPATPTGRPTVGSTSRSPVTSSLNKPAAAAKPMANSISKVTSTVVAKPSRSSTPTSRPTVSSTKPSAPPRSSTPTTRSTARSSTPTSRSSVPAPKPTSRASTPTRRPASVSSGASVSSASVKSLTSSSLVKPVASAVKTAVPARSNSPTVKRTPWKPSEMPGFSLDAPPNLRTTLPDRPPSATRGRPGAPSSRSSSIEPVSNGRVRRQSCSPARGRPPNGIIHNSGSSVPVPAANRLYAKANDNVSPVLVGTKMVERVINMRKLAPPKQDDRHSPHSNFSGKSSSPDSSGFGRSLSKKSLDMAIRHMDIRRTGNLRPLMTNIPASSIYSVRSSGGNRRTASISDSPLATSSNCSSDLSINNNALCVDGLEAEDDVCSNKGIRSPANIRGRHRK